MFYANKARTAFKSDTGLSYQSRKGLLIKLNLVQELGGGCSICGYNKNLSALEFHHIDSSTKSFNIDARVLSNSSIIKIRKELVKCILLCANCHQELHNPNLNINKLKSNLKT